MTVKDLKEMLKRYEDNEEITTAHFEQPNKIGTTYLQSDIKIYHLNGKLILDLND